MVFLPIRFLKYREYADIVRAGGVEPDWTERLFRGNNGSRCWCRRAWQKSRSRGLSQRSRAKTNQKDCVNHSNNRKYVTKQGNYVTYIGGEYIGRQLRSAQPEP